MGFIYPYPSGLLHSGWGYRKIVLNFIMFHLSFDMIAAVLSLQYIEIRTKHVIGAQE